MRAAVQLQEQARRRTAHSAAAVLWRAAGARTRDPRAAQDPLHRGPREVDALALGEQLTEVRVVQAGVPVLGEGHHLRRERGVEGVRRPAPRVPVRECRGPAVDQARGEPTDRAIGEAEQECRFLAVDPAREETRKDEGTLVGER